MATRIFTREDRARMATLENKMLSDNFDKKMFALNGDLYDPEVVDRSLEPSEALRDLKEKYPHLKTGYESALDTGYNFVFTIPTIDSDKFKSLQFDIMQAQSDQELYKAVKAYTNYYEYEKRKYEKRGTQA